MVSLDNGGTQAGQVDITPASGQIVSNKWVSLDIPLSEFVAAKTNLDLSDLQQMLWIDNQGGGGVTGGIFYVDNVYFYASTVPSRVPMAAKLTGTTVNLSFPAQSGFHYTVQFTTSLTNPSWQTLTTVPGNNNVITVPDTAGPTPHFYRLSVSQ